MENSAGRPFGRYKIETREELQNLVDSYFYNCDHHEERKLVGTGDNARFMMVPTPIPYSWIDLATHIGITRNTLNNYEETDLFGDIVTLARAKLNGQWERCLQRLGNNSGVQYALENNREAAGGYINQKFINIGGQADNPIVTETQQAELSEEQIRQILEVMGE